MNTEMAEVVFWVQTLTRRDRSPATLHSFSSDETWFSIEFSNGLFIDRLPDGSYAASFLEYISGGWGDPPDYEPFEFARWSVARLADMPDAIKRLLLLIHSNELDESIVCAEAWKADAMDKQAFLDWIQSDL